MALSPSKSVKPLFFHRETKPVTRKISCHGSAPFWLQLLCFLCISISSNCSLSAAPPPGYYLVWTDEFNGTSLDGVKWSIWGGTDQGATLAANSVSVVGGNLTIATYTSNDVHYTAIMSTEGRLRVKYGYFESRIQFNDSSGIWSAFWMNSPDNGRYIGDASTSGNEVDIVEHRKASTTSSDISGSVQSAVHWDGYGADHKQVNDFPAGSGLGAGFHTYGFLWDRNGQSFSIDDVPHFTPTVGHSDRSEVITLSSEVNGASWAGPIPAGGYGSLATSTNKMILDYVRYYAPTTTVFWTGAISSQWTNAGNWLANRMPKAGDDVQFSYLGVGNFTTTLKQDFTLGSLSIMEANPVSLTGNVLIINSGGIDMVSALYDATINSTVILGSAQSWKIGENRLLTINGAVNGAGNLTKSGLGTVLLKGTNNYTGTTTISNGTLAINGHIGTNTITVTGGTLAGTGMITGPIVVKVGATLAPGFASLGTLVVSNALQLQAGSVTSIDINKTAGATDKIVGPSNLSYGGTLLVNNLSGTLMAGDAFKIFDAQTYSGAFVRIIPAVPAPGLAWSVSTLTRDGTLRVTSASRTNLTVLKTNNQLQVFWPADHVGWHLQMQTNTLQIGLSNNWVDVVGSELTNCLVFTIKPADRCVFFRLANFPNDSTTRFTAGDLAVLQVGNGSINASGTPISIVDFPVYGGPSFFSVALPPTGSNAFISGSSSYNSSMTLSADGKSLVFVGYNSPVLAAGAIDSSSSSAVPRAVGAVNAAGVFTLNATTTQFSGGTIRSAVANGAGNFWAGGGNSGVVYLGNNFPPTTLSASPAAMREMRILNGNLYFTASGGTGNGVMAFVGSPNSASTPTLILNTQGTGVGTPSPKGFAFNPGMTVAYVADNRSAGSGGGIQRFNWDGSSWVYAYTLGYTLGASQQVWSMTADFSGVNPVIYATTGEASMNNLVSVTDTGPASTFAILETAPTGTAFRGVAFAPSQ